MHLIGAEIDRGIHVVEAHGDLDLATAPALKQRLRAAIDEGWRLLLVDLTNVAFIDSSGLAALVFANRRLEAAGGRMAVVAPSDYHRHIFRLTGIEMILGVRATEAEAVAHLSGLA